MSKNKKIIIAVACVLFLFLLSVVVKSSSTDLITKKVSYSTFLSDLKDKKIVSVAISNDKQKLTYKTKDNKKYYTAYPDSTNFKEKILKNGVEIEINKNTNWQPLFSLLSLLVTAGLFFILANTILPNNSFKITDKDNIKTRFSDVAGHNEIKDELLLAVDMMKDDKYKLQGAKVPKGILLQGPPGNGKTLLAKALAGEAGVNFIAASASDFSSQFVGIGSNKVKQLFKLARRNSPCIIFIDEIDGVGSKRIDETQAADKEMNTILTTLLNEMDGFKETDNIMVLAATNRIEALDEALTRPGRFDRQFIISYPDKKDRISLFKMYTKNAKISEIDFDTLANRTYGSSASEIAYICNEAILNSVTDNSDCVKNKHFYDAIIKVAIKGNIKKDYTRTDKERELIAYHEAGHAVMSYYYTNKEVTTITIKPTTSGAGGFTMTENKDEDELQTLGDMYGNLKMLYGGRAAEYCLRDGNIMNITSGASSDIQQATKAASRYICLKEGIDLSVYDSYGVKSIMDKSEELLNQIWNETVKDVNKHWNDIDLVAQALIENETIDKDNFLEIIEHKHI